MNMVVIPSRAASLDDSRVTYPRFPRCHNLDSVKRIEGALRETAFVLVVGRERPENLSARKLGVRCHPVDIEAADNEHRVIPHRGLVDAFTTISG
jgi:hypothetical protein